MCWYDTAWHITLHLDTVRSPELHILKKKQKLQRTQKVKGKVDRGIGMQAL